MFDEEFPRSRPRQVRDTDPRDPPLWPIEILVRDGREALIRHADQLYRLRITSQNRLILTK